MTNPGSQLSALKRKIIAARKKHKRASHYEAQAKAIRTGLLRRAYEAQRPS